MGIRDHRRKAGHQKKNTKKKGRGKDKINNKESKSSSSIKNQLEMIKTKHHRRPRSIGGSAKPANIAYVTRKVHSNWHIIAGNLSAEQVCNVINSYVKPKGLTVICIFINGRPCTMQGSIDSRSKDAQQIITAWKGLFEPNMSFYEKIEFVNNVLLDPAYHFYVVG